jgi:hypothetical protein
VVGPEVVPIITSPSEGANGQTSRSLGPGLLPTVPEPRSPFFARANLWLGSFANGGGQTFAPLTFPFYTPEGKEQGACDRCRA